MQHIRQPVRRSRGFSLVELLLSVSLLMLLFGAVAFNFSSLQRGAQLDEGVTQLEALLRFAKAQAANTGKKVQVRFHETASLAGHSNQAPSIGMEVLWEPDPLGQPGIFEQLPEGEHYAGSVTDLITIERVQAISDTGELEAMPRSADAGSDTSSVSGSFTLAQQTQPVSVTGGNPQPQGSAPMPSIEFFPDGSCDAAQITVASRDSDDTRRAAVRLVGSSGEMKRQPMPGEEADSAKVSDLAQANPGSQ